MTDIELLKRSLRALRARFVSGAIGPSLSPCISEVEIRAFETRHSILLPAEYRYFLTIVGNGCVELFKLGEMDKGLGFGTWAENDGFVGILCKPFQYCEAWNDLTGFPEYDPDKEHDEEWLAEYNKKRDLFDERYFKPLDGAIPISDLVITIPLFHLLFNGIFLKIRAGTLLTRLTRLR